MVKGKTSQKQDLNWNPCTGVDNHSIPICSWRWRLSLKIGNLEFYDPQSGFSYVYWLVLLVLL